MSRREPSRLHHPFLAATGSAAQARLPDLAVLARTDFAPPPGGMQPPEERLLLLLEKGRRLTLVDAASHLSLPLPAMRAVVSALIDKSLIGAVAPAEVPPAELLKRVLRGLHNTRNLMLVPTDSSDGASRAAAS
ncbi:DUF742 domain-containing protein [Streptomyces sp. NPDC055025]